MFQGLPAGESGAVFSDCRHYRYLLWRRWQAEGSTVLFIGLNPSMADEQSNDPTIRRCLGFARSWGFGAMAVANLFAYCATHPKDLKAATDPVGRENDAWLDHMAAGAERVVACWGNHGVYQNRADEVGTRLDDLYCIQLNGSGQPAHPLYLRSDLKPFPWL